jgi:hypothetical protein
LENGQYCGGQGRYVLKPDDFRVGLVIQAQSLGKELSIVSNDTCINDGDTEVAILYSH